LNQPMSSPQMMRMFGFFATARLLFALRNSLDVVEVSDLVLCDGDIALFDFDFLFAICRPPSQLNGPI